ncbi:MAG TPA: class I SAM-dependent methyltransferase [Actinophytocola sp.]|uniref:class I SAM-dependent methyltransferase n=1 Tax=Actinophytocola sp. TaxID=1872138 RepID=UPI002DBE0E92|nr:class I SAM-dependent methyltransferase [Actinophytocola sp.]HEU5473258.1 class I SAM-dependent methyltransferase [Actinophytocola sp.]
MLNSHYDDDPAAYAAKRTGWLHQRRQRRAIEFLGTARPGERVLDLGSGTGEHTLAMAAAHPHLRVVGVEPLADYVAYARERAAGLGLGNVEFVQGYAEDVRAVLPDGPVDRVVSSDVLHHVADERAAAGSVAAAARPGCRWLAFEPNRWNPYIFLFQALTRGERNFRPGAFVRAAAPAGWRPAGRDYLFLIPSAIPEPRPWMKTLERRFESRAVLGGGVTLTLVLGDDHGH